MNRVLPQTMIVAGLLLALGHLAHGGPPNPTPSDGNGNTAGGTNALSITTGLNSTAFGMWALAYNTEGNYNTASGAYALTHNTKGAFNTASGVQALLLNTEGNYNTASGAGALYHNIMGSLNTASGFNALGSNTNNYNTASGANALASNTRGFSNTASGVNALYKNMEGISNTASGVNALYKNASGNYNTAFGRDALKNADTGINNLAVGYGAGSALTDGSHNIYLGHPGVATESRTLRLGSSQTRAFVAGVYNASVAGLPVYVTSTGQLGRQSSSVRFKQDIAPLAQRSEPLYQLRPVTFHYKHEPQGPTQYGLIAEEVAEVYPELVTRDADGQIDGVRYDALIPLLLNELQHQHRQVSTQTQQLAELKAQNESLRAELKAQNASLWMAVEQLREQAAEQRAARVAVAAQPRTVAFNALDAR